MKVGPMMYASRDPRAPTWENAEHLRRLDGASGESVLLCSGTRPLKSWVHSTEIFLSQLLMNQLEKWLRQNAP